MHRKNIIIRLPFVRPYLKYGEYSRNTYVYRRLRSFRVLKYEIESTRTLESWSTKARTREQGRFAFVFGVQICLARSYLLPTVRMVHKKRGREQRHDTKCFSKSIS